MSEQSGTSRRMVAFATVFLLLAAGAFAASFYVLDGARYVAPLLEQAMEFAGLGGSSTTVPPARPAQPSDALVLPEGMPETFALRVWQEQMDSQPMIERLVNGEISSLVIDRVEILGDEARIHCNVRFTGEASASGVIGLKRFGPDWFVASATSSGNARRRQETKLPAIEDVDVPLLNTVLEQNPQNQSVIDEYIDGTVHEVKVVRVRPGPRTATLDLEMTEDHGNGYARLVAIRADHDGKPRWVIARFIKTGDAAKKTK